jgi:glutamyl-tRNA reductase
VVALRAKARAVLFSELERSLGGRLKHLAEGDRAALTQMVESGVNKLLHGPTTKLKARAAERDDAGDLAAAVRFLFDLEEAAAVQQAARGEGETARDDDERLPN